MLRHLYMANFKTAPEVSVPESNHYSESGVFDFEYLLNFGAPGINSVNGVENSKPSKQPAACTRCHAQKLRCVRQKHGGRICDRCLSANVECIDRQLQRIGRPVDHSTPGHRSQPRHRANRRTATSRRDNDNTGTPWSPLTRERQKSIGVTTPSVSSTEMSREHNSTTTQFPSSAASELDAWSWPSPPQETSSQGRTNANIQRNDDYSESYADSLITGLAGSNSLLPPNIDDLSASLFPPGFELTPFAPHQISKTNGATDLYLQLDDPVEQLSQLHLELYQCLNLVKTVEKLKKQKLHTMSMSAEVGEPVDTRWSERLFQITERFIDALRRYVDTTSCESASMDTMSDTHISGNGQDSVSPVQVDTATGLMIVSSYSRLLQIFDVVVFVVETFRDMDCPGNYVQINFGAFTPTIDKALHARLLGQYVLHLLDGISEAVDRAVALRQPYTQGIGRAISEIRKVEAKLRERISTTLH